MAQEECPQCGHEGNAIKVQPGDRTKIETDDDITVCFGDGQYWVHKPPVTIGWNK